MADELQWPKLGDILFADGDDMWLNACVGWSREQWYGYIEGYKRAADLLVQHVSDTGRSQDVLVYPIVFLYRHAIEVSLKHLLIQGRKLLDVEALAPDQHRLLPLWQQCRPILEQVWRDGSKEDLTAVGEVMKQFDLKDPKSTVFRYPFDKAGKASLTANERIDIGNFSTVANRILTFLDSTGTGIGEYLQNKREMEWEMSQDYRDNYRNEW